MHRNLKILLLVIGSLPCGVLRGEEPPSPLPFRVKQMQMMPLPKEIKEWPKEKGHLFQWLRKSLASKVESKKDHMTAMGEIPKELLKGLKISATIESNGWFYSSVDPDGEKATWFSVIATQKGGKEIFFSPTW